MWVGVAWRAVAAVVACAHCTLLVGWWWPWRRGAAAMAGGEWGGRARSGQHASGIFLTAKDQLLLWGKGFHSEPHRPPKAARSTIFFLRVF
eukprot:267360-Chlamydomonas_euryale.AAC.1